MGIACNRNARWLDVLENGPRRPRAIHSTSTGQPVKAELAGKVLLPILGDQYGAVLDSGQLRLELDGRGFSVRYYDTVLPAGAALLRAHPRPPPGRAAGPAGRRAPRAGRAQVADRWFATHSPRAEHGRRSNARRRGKEIETGRMRLGAARPRRRRCAEFVEENVRLFNGTPGDPRSFDLLDEPAGRAGLPGRLLARGRRGDQLPAVLRHQRAGRHPHGGARRSSRRPTGCVFRLVGEGIVTGLRVDHPDGLYAPAEYFARACSAACARALGRADGDRSTWSPRRSWRPASTCPRAGPRRGRPATSS